MKEVKGIVDSSTEQLRAWASQDQQIVLTKLNKLIKQELMEFEEKNKKK